MRILFFKNHKRKQLKQSDEYRNSNEYWNKRYELGQTSGAGSYGRLAEFKADVINTFLDKYDVQTSIELGCGDGNQLGLIDYPQYLGLDVSRKAIANCIQKYKNDKTKDFLYYDPELLKNDTAIIRGDLSISLDVIYHLTEDHVYEIYMQTLFKLASKFVIIYSSNDPTLNQKLDTPEHIIHRRFMDWIKQNRPDFSLTDTILNRYPLKTGNHQEESFADFYFFTHRSVVS